MRQNGSKKTDSQSNALQTFLENVLSLGYKAGGVIFAGVAIYLLWGMVGGSLTGTSKLTQKDFQNVVYYVWKACDILTISGVVVIVCAAARFYSDATTGYVLLILGALIYLGMPFTVSPGSPQVAPVIAYIIDQFRLVGVAALLVSIPFMIYNLWRMIASEKVHKAKSAKPGDNTEKQAAKGDSVGIGLSCWNSAYCREHMRLICDAYKKRRSCWRLKSGCYCDEDMIVRSMKAGSGADNKIYDLLRTPAKELSWLEKRRRCKQCIIFTDHQNMIYRIVSPLGIIAPIVLAWVYYTPLKQLIHNGMIKMYDLTGKLAIIVRLPQTETGPFSGLLNSSGTAETLLLICITIFASALILKAMEHFIFMKWI